ncbi:unnamed protein product [Rangifer tarandus platyrhynchus]|uniref:Uncharacterized protein n=2 Tax=Rangifer tarandus platyrhynchus TaxID=3082113 RepID=A0ABN8Z3Z6_RANTA|nr:unnamed protein product [Rangifer tarandus platyrhynchus]
MVLHLAIANSQVVQVANSLPANAGDLRDGGSIPGSGRSPGGGHGNPPVFLPGESHGQRSLAGFQSIGSQSGTGLKRLSTHKFWIKFDLLHSGSWYIAWWATVYGVAKSPDTTKAA